MKYCFGIVIGLLFFVYLSFFLVPVALAATTPFKSAKTVTTDGIPEYTNLTNCSITDDKTCDRTTATGHSYLYFQDFGSYDDFGIPIGSIITYVRMRVTGKASPAAFAPFINILTVDKKPSGCKWSNSDMWILWDLNSNTIKTQAFIAKASNIFEYTGVRANCFESSDFENNNNFVWQIAYSQNYAWSANIDNFEIAFDYEPGATPSPTLAPAPSPTPTPKTPIIIIPGIAGSDFKSDQAFDSGIKDCGIFPTFTYNVDDVVWVNKKMAVISPCDDYFDVLKLKADGQTSEFSQIVLNDTIYQDYDSLINFFTNNGYRLDETIFIFPFDWRKDISLTAPLLDQKINGIKTQAGSQKVDIVAHSMGGLVARNYISDPSRAQNVRKLFTLGTPHLGSVKLLKALQYGDYFGESYVFNLINLSPSEVKDIVQNFIGGFELLPTKKYFDFYSGKDNLHPFPFQDSRDIDGDDVTGALNYDQTKNLLTNLGRNTSLFTPAETFHSMDENYVDTNGVEITNIVGSGISTLGQIVEKYLVNFLNIKIPKKDEIFINGDSTVPLFSASLNDSDNNLSLLGNAKVFYTKQDHGGLVTSGPVHNLIENILNDDNQLPNGISTQSSRLSGTGLVAQCPVNIHVYDTLGNHTGPTSNGDFEINIPGSSYDTLDDAKFIFLPDDGNYTIKFDATGKGSFDFKIRKYENDIISQETLYKDIPLTSSTSAETQLDTSSSQPPIISLDENGDGNIQDIYSSSSLAGDEVYDRTPPQTEFQIYGTLGDDGWLTSDAIITLIPQDNPNGSGILKTEYSLDGGQTINTYAGPFTISSEKINKLKFRSVDNAGNEEDPKETEIRIDKTAPEAKIFVDQNKQDIVVVGIDANPTTVAKSDNTSTKKKNDAFYTITDSAGNTAKLDVRDVDRSNLDRFKIYSIQYNDDPAIALDNNHFNVTYSGKKERTNVKEQNFELKGEVKIRIQYNAKKNTSTIIVKEPKEEKVKDVRNGLVYLNLLTNKGQLKTSY